MVPTSVSSDPVETVEGLKGEVDHLKALLEAEKQSNVALKKKISLLKAQFKKQEESTAYVKSKNAETSSAIMGIRNEYECAFAEEQVRHDKQMVIVVKENARLSEMERKDNATIFEMQRYLDKYTTYNSHETHTIKNLSSQIGALERENKRLKGDKSGYQLRKRPATSPDYLHQSDPEDVPFHKKPRAPTISPCTQCYVHGWTCENCALQKKENGCKCIMCKQYKKHTCTNVNCRFIHEDDEDYHSAKLVPFTRLTVKKVGPSPKEIKAKENKESGGFMKTAYDVMFDGLGGQKGGGRDEGVLGLFGENGG